MIGCLFLASCVMHPLGIADDTWQAMTPEQQAQAYQKQADIDAKQKADELAKEHARQKEIADIKANPKYDQFVQCIVTNAQYVDFANNLNPIETFSFDAINGYNLNANIKYYRNGDKFFKNQKKLSVQFDGRQIKLCDLDNPYSGKCATLNANAKQYQRGINIPFDDTLGMLKGNAKCDMVYNNNHKHHRRNDNGNNIVINL